MDTKNKQLNNFFNLSDRDFELIKLEVELLEQRVFHLENLQYKLRQFSITIWLAVLGVGLGIISKKVPNLFLLIISGLIPILFMYLDARYARIAQNYRSRRNEITKFFNSESKTLKDRIEKNLKEIGFPTRFPILDLSGFLTVNKDSQTVYRRNILVKLTRSTRVIFYGFQLMGSSIVVSNFLFNEKNCELCYLIVLLPPLLLSILYLLRFSLKKKIHNNLTSDYDKEIDERSDLPSYSIKVTS